MAKSDQKWPKVAKSEQKWPKVVNSGQKWPEVAKSGQKWSRFSEDLRNSSFRLDKITEECIPLLSLAGSWIRTVHTMFTTVFYFLPDFSVENGLEWSFWVSWLISCGKKILNRFEPFLTRVGYTVLVGLKIDPWRRDGSIQNLITFLRQIEKEVSQNLNKYFIDDILWQKGGVLNLNDF